MKLYRDGLITYEDALTNSTSPDEFSLRVKGIEATSDNTWNQFDAEEKTGTELEQNISETA
jgi:twitching motility protein PilT